LDWVSLNQSYHPAPLYSVKGMHNVLPVECGQETFYRSGSVARPGLNVFPKDALGVLDGSQDSLLVSIGMCVPKTSNPSIVVMESAQDGV
jgi:hypothetical protein